MPLIGDEYFYIGRVIITQYFHDNVGHNPKFSLQH